MNLNLSLVCWAHPKVHTPLLTLVKRNEPKPFLGVLGPGPTLKTIPHHWPLSRVSIGNRQNLITYLKIMESSKEWCQQVTPTAMCQFKKCNDVPKLQRWTYFDTKSSTRDAFEQDYCSVLLFQCSKSSTTALWPHRCSRTPMMHKFSCQKSNESFVLEEKCCSVTLAR